MPQEDSTQSALDPEALKNTDKMLNIQKKRMFKLKMDAEGVLGGQGNENRTQFEAFDVRDQSLNNFSATVRFVDGDYQQVGRIAIDNRLRPFVLNI